MTSRIFKLFVLCGLSIFFLSCSNEPKSPYFGRFFTQKYEISKKFRKQQLQSHSDLYGYKEEIPRMLQNLVLSNEVPDGLTLPCSVDPDYAALFGVRGNEVEVFKNVSYYNGSYGLELEVYVPIEFKMEIDTPIKIWPVYLDEEGNMLAKEESPFIAEYNQELAMCNYSLSVNSGRAESFQKHFSSVVLTVVTKDNPYPFTKFIKKNTKLSPNPYLGRVFDEQIRHARPEPDLYDEIYSLDATKAIFKAAIPCEGKEIACYSGNPDLYEVVDNKATIILDEKYHADVRILAYEEGCGAPFFLSLKIRYKKGFEARSSDFREEYRVDYCGADKSNVIGSSSSFRADLYDTFELKERTFWDTTGVRVESGETRNITLPIAPSVGRKKLQKSFRQAVFYFYPKISDSRK